MTQLYSHEAAQQILHLAIVRQVEAGDITREQLLEIAAELDISSKDLAIAEQEWLTQQGELAERQAFNELRWSKFRHRFGKFAIVSAFLAILVFGMGWLWLKYLILFWGVGVALEGWKVYQLSGEAYENAFQKWRQRRQLKKSVNRLFGRWLGAS
ncbi:MAG TPA: 2TM domain-containing protein [Trichocoleus sp.]|jgi:hypothetical protein